MLYYIKCRYVVVGRAKCYTRLLNFIHFSFLLFAFPCASQPMSVLLPYLLPLPPSPVLLLPPADDVSASYFYFVSQFFFLFTFFFFNSFVRILLYVSDVKCRSSHLSSPQLSARWNNIFPNRIGSKIVEANTTLQLLEHAILPIRTGLR